VELLEGIDLHFRQKSPIAPQALFQAAFIYENQLADTAKARETYERFLSYYPDHKLAPDARRSIELLGKSPEKIIEEFLKNQPQ